MSNYPFEADGHSVHPDLLELFEKVYNPCGLDFSGYKKTFTNRAYGAANFLLNKQQIEFRIGKVTPIKIGHFIGFYKRLPNKSVLPYDVIDPFDFLIVSTRKAHHFGQFIFPKSILRNKGIVSEKGWKGKMAFRLYPPWDIAKNSQAKRSQEWQLPYFLSIDPKVRIDCQKVKKIFF